MVGFLNTYFELLKLIKIIYITNKCNQCHLSFRHTFCKAFLRVTFKQLYLHTH